MLHLFLLNKCNIIIIVQSGRWLTPSCVVQSDWQTRSAAPPPSPSSRLLLLVRRGAAVLPGQERRTHGRMIQQMVLWIAPPPHCTLAPPPLLLSCSCECCTSSLHVHVFLPTEVQLKIHIQLLQQPPEHKLRWTQCCVVCDWGDAMCHTAKLWSKTHTGGNDGLGAGVFLYNLRLAAAAATCQWSRVTKCLSQQLRHFQASLGEPEETLESRCSRTLNHCSLTGLVLWVTFAQHHLKYFASTFSFLKEIQRVAPSTSWLLNYCVAYFLLKAFAHRGGIMCFSIGLYNIVTYQALFWCISTLSQFCPIVLLVSPHMFSV